MTSQQPYEREFEFTWEDFETLRTLSRQYSGIVVGDEKFDMFYSRLSRRLRTLELTRFSDYCLFLKHYHDQEFAEFINAITTNLTAFFRERHHFDYLQTVLIPELLQTKHTRQIKVWSAGCSTGEEAYSLAMTLLANAPDDWEIKILATDIDTRVLKTAATGEYFTERCSGLSAEILQRWFKKGVGKNQGKIKVKPALKQVVSFKPLNLIKDWPDLGAFDFIFCRNVLIYFDRATKKQLIQGFSKHLPVGARLFIGHSESIHQLNVAFRPLGNTVYQRISENGEYE